MLSVWDMQIDECAKARSGVREAVRGGPKTLAGELAGCSAVRKSCKPAPLVESSFQHASYSGLIRVEGCDPLMRTASVNTTQGSSLVCCCFLSSFCRCLKDKARLPQDPIIRPVARRDNSARAVLTDALLANSSQHRRP